MKICLPFIEWNNGVYYIQFIPTRNRFGRFFGTRHAWYDGPHVIFGLWWWVVSWSLPSTEYDETKDVLLEEG